MAKLIASYDTIIRRVSLVRNQNPQKVIDATGRKHHDYKGILMTMPHGKGEEVEVVFFKLCRYMTDDDLKKEYARRGLKPDPYAVAAVNETDKSFAKHYPNVAHWCWKRRLWCCLAFYDTADEQRVSIDTGYQGFTGEWWAGGTAA
jgi:hypothetical protein